MSRRNRNKKCDWFGDNFHQSQNYNERAYAANLDFLLALAMNRFRWEGLPETCDARFLEKQLHRYGIATICHAPDQPDVWKTLIALPENEYNDYGIPTRWSAQGWNAKTQPFPVTPKSGELVFYSWTRINIWNSLTMFARKMTHYQRTEDVNLTHQLKPWVFVAPDRSKKLELENLLMQTLGGNPAVIVNSPGMSMIDSITAIDTKVPLVVEELAQGYQNVLSQALMQLGVPHLAFEKGERMIEDEARANTAPTQIMLLNCLNARRDACKRLRVLDPKRFGDLNVYFNEDWESYNWNYVHNVEAQAQDKLIIDTQDASAMTFNMGGGAENE